MPLAGHCYCGTVTFQVDASDPLFTAYCHCDDCRRAHAAPLYQVVAVDVDRFEVTAGQDRVNRFQRGPDAPVRAFCTCCGTRLYNAFPNWRPKGREVLVWFPNTLDASESWPEATRPRKNSFEDQCVLDRDRLESLWSA